MHCVDIKTMKSSLDEDVRAAAAAQSVLITDQGRVVAELASPRLPRRRPGTPIDAVLRELDASRAKRWCRGAPCWRVAARATAQSALTVRSRAQARSADSASARVTDSGLVRASSVRTCSALAAWPSACAS